jgi:hypothetical protein
MLCLVSLSRIQRDNKVSISSKPLSLIPANFSKRLFVCLSAAIRFHVHARCRLIFLFIIIIIIIIILVG